MPTTSPKPHYVSLDALRGVAALVVLLYHVYECFDQSQSPVPHGYLAVDFFFILSGFVIGYAYDDRWSQGLSAKTFFLRRLIRLHPMVVAGAIVGAVAFLVGGSLRWDGVEVSPVWTMLAMLCGMLLIPALPGSRIDVRGNGEMFPLNGPSWSLFFEYIGNIIYALLLRRLPTRWLAAMTVALGALLTGIALHDGALGVGWTMNEGGMWTGLVRMLFPYCVGMLLARKSLGKHLKNEEKGTMSIRKFFFSAALLIILIACVPQIKVGWLNGVFEVTCIITVFPLIVFMGSHTAAMPTENSAMGTKSMKWLGDISYPLYAVHYPFMYLFYVPIIGGSVTSIGEVWQQALLTAGMSILTALLLMFFYERPLRKWLTKKLA